LSSESLFLALPSSEQSALIDLFQAAAERNTWSIKPEVLLNSWQDTVQECQDVYPYGIDDFTNDLTVREIIDKVLKEEKGAPRLPEFRAQLRRVDEQFRSSTVEFPQPIYAARLIASNPEKYWYYCRIPGKPGTELFEDLIRMRFIRSVDEFPPAATNQPPATMTTSAILLAAGESTRMGRPKALLPWGDETLLAYQVRQLEAAGVEDIVVVLGAQAEEMRPAVPAGARVVVNESYREGRASSLRAGAAALPDSADPIVVLSVDQPRPQRVHERLLEAHMGWNGPITLPETDGRRGHPVVLAGELLEELRSASEQEKGLHAVIARHADGVREVPFVLITHESMADSPDLTALMVLTDINTPEDYEDARRLFGLGARQP
jgi:molybdenum cofactor cytidylyltransferase